MERALQQAEKLIMAEQYRDAITQLERILEETPDHIEALNDLGVALFKQNDEPRALDTYLRAIDLDPTHSVLWENVSELVREGEIPRGRLRAAYEQLAPHRTTASQRRALGSIGQKVPEVAYYRGAYAQCDITPEGGCVTQGWMGAEQANKVVSPLLLQALLLEDESNNHTLIIAADLFGVGDALLGAVRTLAREWGIPPEAVIFNASHTHYAPGTVERVIPGLGPYYPEYVRHIKNATQQLLTHLHDKLQPCFLYTGQAHAQVGVNRRQKSDDGSIEMAPNANGYYHKDTPLLVIDLLNDQTKVGVVNHGCHPTGSGRPSFLSPGYPGYLRQRLIADGIADGVMFLQGAAGSSKLSLNGRGDLRFASSPDEARTCARQLADAAAASIQAELTTVRGPIFARIERVALSLEAAPASEELEAMPISEGGMQQLLEDRWAQHFLNGAEEYGEVLELEIQLVGLGEETSFVTFPGEPVAELARSVMDRVETAKNTFILGYTNGLKAYLPTQQIVKEGGYESNAAKMVYLLPSSFEETVEEKIISGVERLVEHWRGTDQPNGYGRYHMLEEQGEAFFCLSTGRCGTKTLAHLLGTASNARVYHHPRPYLVEETLAAYQGDLNRSEIFWQAREGVIRDAWKDELIFGETDHNMTAFAQAIAEDIGKAKFIVLVRNPWSFVRSGMRRSYYRGHAWDAGRLRPEKGHPAHRRWSGMSPFEKVCWLWADTYRRVLEFLESVDEKRYEIIKFESLVANPAVSENLFQFLGLEGYDKKKIEQVLGQTLNSQSVGHFPKPDEWEPHRHEVLWSYCRQVAAKFGYERDMFGGDIERHSVYSEEKKNEGVDVRGTRVTFISGMHRSGTSFLARALNLCGLSLPNPDVRGNAANAKGRWENRQLSVLGRKLFGPHDRWYNPAIVDERSDNLEAMHKAIRTYNNQFKRWGWKDPRILVNFEQWVRGLSEGDYPELVVSLRNPLEVAKSLKKRNGFSLEKGLRLWERYNEHVLQYIKQGYNVHLFNFNAPRLKNEVKRLADRLDLAYDRSAVDDWFEEDLIHHEESRSPDLALYRQLLSHWRQQVGFSVEKPSFCNVEKPPLDLAILIVNGVHNYKDKLWLQRSVDSIMEHTSPYTDYKIFVWNHDLGNKSLRRYLAGKRSHVEVLSEVDVDVRSIDGPEYNFKPGNMLDFHGFHVHRTPMQLLYEHAGRRYDVDSYFTFDTDSWPVRGGWDLFVRQRLNEGYKLVGVWRDELSNAIDPYVHPSGLGVKAQTIRKEELRFDFKPRSPNDDTMSNFTRTIVKHHGSDSVYPLRRSNAHQLHPVYGGIYGDLLYHHHQGTVYRGGDNQIPIFKGSKERGEIPEENKMICDILTERVFFDYDNLIREMRFGKRFEEGKSYYHLIQNSPSTERVDLLLTEAGRLMHEKTKISYYIYQLLMPYIYFDRDHLKRISQICQAMGRSDEASLYMTICDRLSKKEKYI
jgi:hypothetical protein